MNIEFTLPDDCDFQSILNLRYDEVEFLEEIDEEDERELESEMEHLITLAGEFYDREMERYEE